jgi:predicted MFS family arabinose efflux permease
MAEIREGIDYVIGQPTLRTAILFWGAISIVSAPFVTALAVHVTRDLGLSSAILGVILAAFGIGTVGGSLVAGHQMRRGRVGLILISWNLVMALGLVIMAVTQAVVVQVVVAAVTGFAQSMVVVTYLTLRTAYSPDDLLGRVGMTARTISLGLQPIGWSVARWST